MHEQRAEGLQLAVGKPASLVANGGVRPVTKTRNSASMAARASLRSGPRAAADGAPADAGPAPAGDGRTTARGPSGPAASSTRTSPDGAR